MADEEELDYICDNCATAHSEEEGEDCVFCGGHFCGLCADPLDHDCESAF